MKMNSFALVALLVLSCNTATDKNAGMAKKDSSQASVTYAYPVSYSSDFEIGDAGYKQTVLDLWKDYENNELEKGLGNFADSVQMHFMDGHSFNGPKDSLLTLVKRIRGGMGSIVASVDAIVTLKPKGKEESWVCIWGQEIVTGKDGKKDTTRLNENWMFNKNGKVSFMEQFAAKPAR